jgi:hypothetical protein
MNNRYHCIAEYVGDYVKDMPFNDRFIRIEVIANNAYEAMEKFEPRVNAIRGGKRVRYWKPLEHFIYPTELATICKDMENNPTVAEQYLAA